jgi:hypothetical protein
VTLPLGRRRKTHCVVLEVPVERGARDAQCLADGGNVRLPTAVERPPEVQLLGIGVLPRPSPEPSPGAPRPAWHGCVRE